MAKKLNREWLKEHVSHDGDECLIWPFGRDDKGYGIVAMDGRTIRKAHRVMCILVNGEPPTPSHHAAHSCGNGHLACVHPKHLTWKTPEENQADTVRHGTCRQPGRAARKITDAQVAEIRAARGHKTRTELSAEYGVRTETIDRIWSGRARNRPRRYSKPYPADVRSALGKVASEMRAAGIPWDGKNDDPRNQRWIHR